MTRSPIVLFCLLLVAALAAHASDYKYVRTGSESDVTTKPVSGYALMGGGSDLDQAFRFLCDKGAAGDFLILRAAGHDDYNPYVNSLCKIKLVLHRIVVRRIFRGGES
jgi:cyanophycinase